MPELRWILIAFGAALLIGIYAWGRRSSKPAAPEEPTLRDRPEPVFEPVDSYEPVSSDEPVDDIEPVSVESEPVLPAASSRSYARAASDESNEPTLEAPVGRVEREHRFARIEPTFGADSETAELPAREPEAPAPAKPVPAATDAPTLSMSSTPPPRRIERRKIIALRLACPQRVPGAQLKASLEEEALQYGKYDVFHRLDEQGVAIFSVASMVEPGTFDLEKMPQESFPGITLFAQLPGPVAGMLAFNELIACSKRLHAALGGTLQDERGVPLTVHRIERIRQEIREFEHRPAVSELMQRASSSPSSSPHP
jgi:cell division protein ZipA